VEHEEKSKRRDVESKGKGGRGSRLNVTLGLVLEKTSYLYFFFKCWHGLTGLVQSVSDFRNRNQTEQEFFCDFLIS
jgi:hypothetical protein